MKPSKIGSEIWMLAWNGCLVKLKGKTLLPLRIWFWNVGSRARPVASRLENALQSLMMPPLGNPLSPPAGSPPMIAF